MEKSEIGFYTKTLENGKIELFLSFSDGVGYFIKEFDSIIEVDEYIKKEFPEWKRGLIMDNEDSTLLIACEIILQLPHLVRYFYFNDLKRLRREGEVYKNKTSIEIWSRLARHWLEFGEFDVHHKYGYSGGSYFPLISEFINKQKEISCEIK